MNRRSKAILFSAAALLAAGCVAPMLEPLEKPLVFRPRGLPPECLKPLAGTRCPVADARVSAGGGVTLHGWCRRPQHWSPADSHPLLSVYGVVGPEVSEFVARAHASTPWGWLMIN